MVAPLHQTTAYWFGLIKGLLGSHLPMLLQQAPAIYVDQTGAKAFSAEKIIDWELQDRRRCLMRGHPIMRAYRLSRGQRGYEFAYIARMNTRTVETNKSFLGFAQRLYKLEACPCDAPIKIEGVGGVRLRITS